MNSRCSHDDWKPKRQCGQVLSERQKEPTTNWPGRTVLTALPTSSTMPQYSWPIAMGAVNVFRPRNGQRSEPQMQDADKPDDGVGRLEDFRLGNLFATHVAGSVENCA